MKGFKKTRGNVFSIFSQGDVWTKLSFFIMGTSNFARRQFVKGLLFLFAEALFVYYVVTSGAASLWELRTLGTVQQGMVWDEGQGIFVFSQGDNSMLMLLFGVVSIFMLFFFIVLWVANVRSAWAAQTTVESGKRPPGIFQDVRSLFDGNLHKLLLVLPLAGLIVFTVVPLVYMILMAFTNYDVNHQPPGNLFTWVGLDNFKLMMGANDALARTFWPILGWTMIWAVCATFSNYILGMLLAILINAKGINGKKIWRTIFVITIAVPSFASLLGIRLMLGENGAFNVMLMNAGIITSPLPFLTDPTWARVTVIIVNMWVGIPYTMLLTTGILMNIPNELYESARIDGAGGLMAYRKITLPYMIFVTTPYLIANFIENINNFSVIYFLTKGGPVSLQYFKGAGKTDLLVTWLYKLTKDSKDFNFAATIGIIVFVISAVFSLMVYRRSNAYKNEEGFQ